MGYYGSTLQPVRMGAPSVRHVAMHGVAVETQTLHVSASYAGGRMGCTQVQPW